MDSNCDEDIEYEGAKRMTRKFRYKLVEDILDDILCTIVQISKRNSWKCKHHPYTTINFNLSPMFKTLGKISCLDISPDGQVMTVGHSTGLFAFAVETEEIISHWQINKNIVSIGVLDIALGNDFILLILEESGDAKFLLYKDNSFCLIEKLNESETGSPEITDFIIYEKKFMLVLKYEKEITQFIEIRSLPLKEWISAIQNNNNSAKFDNSTVLCSIQEPTIDIACPMFDSTHSLAENLLTQYQNGYCQKTPYSVLFKPWEKLCPNLNLYNYIGLAVWWTGDNNIYFYIICVSEPNNGQPIKPVRVWHHSDRISKCVINDDSTLIAVALENGTVSIKHLHTGLLKHLIRLNSFGKIRGIWYLRDFQKLNLLMEQESTKESDESLASFSNVTDASFMEKKTTSTADNEIDASGNSVIRISALEEEDEMEEEEMEEEEEEEEFTPTPKLDEEKKKAEFEMLQKIEEFTKNFTCEQSSEYLISTKLDKGPHDFGVEEQREEVNKSSMIHYAESTSIDFTASVPIVDNESSSESLQQEIETELTSKCDDKSLVTKLLENFQSGFCKPCKRHEVVDFSAWLITLTDGSLWQLKWNCQQTLKQLIASSNDNDEIVTLQQIVCKPNLVICFTKLGRIYLVDHTSETEIPIKEVKLPVSYTVFNPISPAYSIFNGKILHIAGCENVGRRYLKYVSGELFAIDLFPDISTKQAAYIALASKQEESMQSEISEGPLFKFKHSFQYEIDSHDVLKEVYQNFLQWCKQCLKT